MRLRPPPSLSLLVAGGLVACGAGAVDRGDDPPDRASDQGDHGDETPPSPPPVATGDRDLGAAPTFADLLSAARRLDDRRDQGSDAGCLLRRGARGFRLEADLAVAVRPLPEAPADLEERLASDLGPVNVLTRWGAYGSGDAARPSFVAVTTTLPPLREPARVWVVTADGVIVRASNATATSPDAVALDAAATMLPTDLGALFITAEPTLPLARLADVLARVPDALAGQVALAVALDAGTRLPAPPEARAPEEDAYCPGGLPPLPEDAAEGDIRPADMISSLGPLRQGASICVGATQGPGAAGGRVVLAFRVGPDGTVSESCVVEDATNDPSLRSCLARATRTIAFPAPRPAGFVDAQLPLLLAPLDSQRQRALCR